VSNRDLPVDFSSFIVSLASSAMLYLGEARDPQTGATAEPNLPLARNMIDALAMLQEKTKGNLDNEEDRLLSAVLDELKSKIAAH